MKNLTFEQLKELFTNQDRLQFNLGHGITLEGVKLSELSDCGNNLLTVENFEVAKMINMKQDNEDFIFQFSGDMGDIELQAIEEIWEVDHYCYPTKLLWRKFELVDQYKSILDEIEKLHDMAGTKNLRAIMASIGTKILEENNMGDHPAYSSLIVQ